VTRATPCKEGDETLAQSFIHPRRVGKAECPNNVSGSSGLEATEIEVPALAGPRDPPDEQLGATVGVDIDRDSAIVGRSAASGTAALDLPVIASAP